MDFRRKMIILAAILGVLLFLGILFIVPVSTTTTSSEAIEAIGTSSTESSGGSGLIFMLPVWFAFFISFLMMKRRNNGHQGNHQHTKRKSKPKNRFAMMQELVDDLDNDELAYLEKRAHGYTWRCTGRRSKWLTTTVCR